MQGPMRSPFESAPPLNSDDEDEDPAELLQMLRIKDLDNDKEYNVDQVRPETPYGLEVQPEYLGLHSKY